MELTGGKRLVFKPAHEPPPTKEDGGINWSEVEEVIMYFAHVWFLVSTKKPLIKQILKRGSLDQFDRTYIGFSKTLVSRKLRRELPKSIYTGDHLVAKFDIDENEERVLEASKEARSECRRIFASQSLCADTSLDCILSKTLQYRRTAVTTTYSVR